MNNQLSNSYTMGCPPVRGDNPRALALTYVQVDKLYTTYISVDLAHHEIFRAKIGKGVIILRNLNATMGIKMECSFSLQSGSQEIWEINMGVCPHLEFDGIKLIYCLVYDGLDGEGGGGLVFTIH